MEIKMIRRIGAIGIIGVIAAIVFLVTKNRIPTLEGGSSVDSLINVFDQLPEGEYEVAIARQQVQAYYHGDKETSDRLTSYFEKRAEKDDNNIARAYIKSNQAGFLLSADKPEKAMVLAQEAEKYAEGTNIVGLGNIYNTIASSYYHLGHLDSAKYYFTKGYLFATSQKIDVFISTFAINLGTYYYDQLLYGAASYYFNIALEASKRQDKIPLMLINNMTSILAAQHLNTQADSLWNLYWPEMQNVKEPYEHQLYFLNRTLHMQNMERWKEARKVYVEFAPEEISEALRVSYIHAYLNQLLHDHSDQTTSFFIKYRHWIGERYVLAVAELNSELQTIVNRYPGLLPMDTMLLWEKNFAKELTANPKAMEHSNKLKSLVAYKKGNVHLAYDLLVESALNEKTFELMNDSLRYADFAEKNQLSKLKEDINIANLKVEQAQNEKKYITYLWVLAFLVLLGFIAALLFALTYRKTKLNYAMEQINFMRTGELHLMKEQELNTRIVNLSQLIVLKAQDLGKKIKLVSSQDKGALLDLKKEIDELSRLGIEDKPQLADKLIDSHKAMFERFPEFSELANLTEKRIFILSVDGYKPKEIANVMGVSIQYVHNVRTRLRKKLKLDNTIEWQTLKNEFQ
jgi:DNA-binding CsgD family transcriptional regulator